MLIFNSLEGDLVNGIFKVFDVKLNYDTTIHKYKGKTIREPFNYY